MSIKKTFIIILALALITGCKKINDKLLEPGVSKELAEYRKQSLSDIHYNLFFDLPSDHDEKITGEAEIEFNLSEKGHRVIIDFQAPQQNIIQVLANNQKVNYEFKNGNIVIPSSYLDTGNNILSINFISTDHALNRNPDYMYTLFVPGRASTAFPCFDQPDLKATFSLELEIPSHWEAVSNGIKRERGLEDNRQLLKFLPGKPISTYLFAFVAGEFEKYHSDKEFGLNIYHRETDEELFERNIEEIIRLHNNSLQWMKDYTTISYPYDKLDIILVPSFQYSGMEHPGAIYYRDSRLLLEEGFTLSEQLGRADLIAHEVSHMWFGNLVTMNWFNDVWLKEVFAGFMANKMVHPQYPEADHEVRFLTTHPPSSMSVDRSQGTHPIRQDLPNQKLAGTLYGSIIYNKAPIVFRQLEKIMGEEPFKESVREYLQVYAHDNASWDDLVYILNKYSNTDIEKWSDAWIYGKGLPEISYQISSEQNKVKEFKIISEDPDPNSPFPSQQLCYSIIYSDKKYPGEILLQSEEQIVKDLTSSEIPNAVLLQGGGCGYGYFKPSDASRSFLLEKLQQLDHDYMRGAGILNLHEDFLNGNIKQDIYYETLLQYLKKERHSQLIPVLLDNLQTVYWGFLSSEERNYYSEKTEDILWEHMTSNTSDQGKLYFKAFIKMGLTDQAIDKMTALWREDIEIEEFEISETDKIDLVCEIAVRDKKDIEHIIEKQINKISNPDRKRRFEFILPALSDDKDVRDDFFESLTLKENRSHEPWVIDALKYLNHPLHAHENLHYLPESLSMIEEIQETGDIFFPKNWLDANLSGHSSVEARKIVENFLEENPDLPYNLKLKILQSADMLFRKTEDNSDQYSKH